jgi:hypothetical protein
MTDFTVSEEKFTSIKVPTAKGVIKTKMFDVEPCVKMYWPLLEMIDEMGAVELKVLGYVIHMLTRGSNEVYIDISDVIEYINRFKNGAPPTNPTKSRPHVYKGLNTLIDRGIISKKSKKIYYINPNMLFKGNRASLIESSRKS